jgi:hypothetical protein
VKRLTGNWEQSRRGRVAAGVAGAVLAAALAVAACTTSIPATATGCSVNSDCATNLICALGKCRPHCVDASDCPVPGSSCIDDGRNAVCETPTEKNTPCTSEFDCPVPLACASDYRCRDLCQRDADCNVLGIMGRVCAADRNGVHYCADPNEVTNGVISVAPPPGAPTSTPVVEPEAGAIAVAAALASGDLVATNIGPAGGTIGAMGVTVTIPARALSADLWMTIRLSAQPGPDGTVSPVFDIGPTGTMFTQPITIAFDYTDTELADLSPSDFAVETSTASSGATWTALAPIVVDIYAHTIAGQTTHLSPYALVEHASGLADATTSVPSMEGAAPDAMSDSGADDANACTAGSTQCVSGAVQSCQTQADGFTRWATTATCGTHQTCTATGPDAGLTASCACNSSPCTELGAVCQDAQTLAICGKDSNGCFYATTISPCVTPMSCSGMSPSAACSLACTDSCTSGQTSCVSGNLATCTLGSNGCWSLGAPVACGAHQSCTGAAGAAACTCETDPACSAAGSVCASSTMLATCSTDAQGCIFESAASTCSNCSGGDCCTSSCAQGQVSCVSGGLSTCTLGSNGCWAYGMPVACGAHQSCNAAAGKGACTCNTDPVCTSVGTTCVNTTTLAACSADAQNCVYESAVSTCSNGACSAGACCVNTCTSGQSMCIVGTVPVCIPCTLGSNGCWSY